MNINTEGSRMIHFSPERWDTIRKTYRTWWAGELDRPAFFINLTGAESDRSSSKLPHYVYESYYDLNIPAEEVVDHWDWLLSQQRWVGDGYPAIWPNFGAGVLSAILGVRLLNTPETDTVWFEPERIDEIADITFEWDRDNVWLRRISEIMWAAMEKWNGLVQVGMSDLGGNLDILSAFRPSANLLLDLYDHPDEVDRLTWRAHELWFRAFDHFNSILQPTNPGYTAWTPIFSEEPYYMLQCDFCYMISPTMFDRFVRPELEATCRRLGNPFYHLDGPGQLPHLTSLLEIEELAGVQWVSGDGQPLFDEWPEVYEQILNAGKFTQIWHGRGKNGRFHIDNLVDALGTAKGIVVVGNAPVSEKPAIMEMLARYGAV